MLSTFLCLFLQSLFVVTHGNQADLLQGGGVSCTASTAHPGYPCYHVYNGNLSPGITGSWASEKQNSGAWMEIQLPSDTDLTSIALMNRCNLVDQYSGVDLVFSDGSTATLDLKCDGPTSSNNGELMSNCQGQTAIVHDLHGVRTDFIRMNFHDVCKTGGHGGLRDVKVYGVEYSGNVLQGSGASCSASSHVSTYTCANLVDGDFSPGITGAWASNQEHTGAWVKFDLPRETVLNSVSIWNRCLLVDQYSGVDLVFSDGTKETVTLPCDGPTNSGNGELWSNCGSQGKTQVHLNSVRTTSVRMNFHASCKFGGHGGLREVQIDGYELAGNVLQGTGVSCQASSEYPGYPCSHVYNGNMAPGVTGAWATKGGNSGAWLALTLPHATNVLSLDLWSRCTLVDQYKGTDVVFSDGSQQSMTFPCDGDTSTGSGEIASNCNGQKADELASVDVRTNSLRMNFDDSCAPGNPGLREMNVQGFVFTGDLMQGPGVTCRASSSHPGYPCENVFNGNLSPAGDGSWASEKEDTGAWLEVTFPREMVMVSIGIWNRCLAVDQYSGLDMVFSDGAHKTMSLKCDGVTTSNNGDLWDNCNGQERNDVELGSVHTSSIRMNFHASCKVGGHGGLREIQIHGYASAAAGTAVIPH